MFSIQIKAEINNVPRGLFEKIERESEETCIYKRIFLDYTYGISCS